MDLKSEEPHTRDTRTGPVFDGCRTLTYICIKINIYIYAYVHIYAYTCMCKTPEHICRCKSSVIYGVCTYAHIYIYMYTHKHMRLYSPDMPSLLPWTPQSHADTHRLDAVASRAQGVPIAMRLDEYWPLTHEWLIGSGFHIRGLATACIPLFVNAFPWLLM